MIKVYGEDMQHENWIYKNYIYQGLCVNKQHMLGNDRDACK